MIAVSYYIPDSLKAEIEARAEQEGRSASAMAVRLLREALGPKEKAELPGWGEDILEAFWSGYPRKTNRRKAYDLLRSMIIKKPHYDFWVKVVQDAETRYRSIENKKFIPHATTYLNGARWEDEVIHENATRNPQNRIDRAREQTRRLFASAEAGEAGCGHVGEDDAALRPQVVIPGRRSGE